MTTADDHPKIAARMANGDEITSSWLETARFHKVAAGPNAGTWIAWKPGKLAYITADHPAGLGCCWYDWTQGLGTFEQTLAFVDREEL